MKVDDSQPTPRLTTAFFARDAAVRSDDAMPPDTRSIKICDIFTPYGHTLVPKKNVKKKRKARLFDILVEYY